MLHRKVFKLFLRECFMPKRGSEDKTVKYLNLLIENNIILQKSIVSLTRKLDKLLSLFERAGKDFSSGKVGGTDEKLLDRLDDLVRQNRTIAKGLVLLEKYVKENLPSVSSFSSGKKEGGEFKPLPEF